MVRDGSPDYPPAMDDLAITSLNGNSINATLDASKLLKYPEFPRSWHSLHQILDRLNILDYQLDSADSIHLQAEAIRLAYDTVRRELADFDARNAGGPTRRRFIRTLSDQVSLEQAGQPLAPLPASDTVYLCAADEHGMMVSFIQSNFRGFGSGIVVPGTGIAVQNEARGLC